MPNCTQVCMDYNAEQAANCIMYSITCIQRPLKGSNESGLLQQVVF